MRPVGLDDVACAARVLLRCPPAIRPVVMRQLLAEAARADAYRLRTGRAHPVHGDGSLMAAALPHPRAPQPGPDDPDHLACMALVLEGLIGR